MPKVTVSKDPAAEQLPDPVGEKSAEQSRSSINA
jgi:hypothetical protein